MNEDNFRYMMDATNAKHERTERRFFAIVIVLIASLTIMAFSFVWYISLPAEEISTTVTQEANDTDNTKLIGGDYYGEADEENQLQETDSQK